jgi:prophage regulatory protein
MDRFLRLFQVSLLTGLSGPSLHRKSKSGEFPAPVQLSERAMAWREAEVLDWMKARPAWAYGPARSPGRKRRSGGGGEAAAPSAPLAAAASGEGEA